jgi:hypothetical protein
MVVVDGLNARSFEGNGAEGANTGGASDTPLLQNPPGSYGSFALTHLAADIDAGTPWATALVHAIGRWTGPRELVDGVEITYLIGGEAFDWLVLAERLLRGVDHISTALLPKAPIERLLTTGCLPDDMPPRLFREALGFEKYRAHLNFFYGVVVEEALWTAVEREVQKERGVRGLHHLLGVQDLVYERLYGADLKTLIRRFRRERAERTSVKFLLTEWKEFIYSLFKHRLEHQDSSRIASDTKKGLTMLEELWGVPGFDQVSQWSSDSALLRTV